MWTVLKCQHIPDDLQPCTGDRQQVRLHLPVWTSWRACRKTRWVAAGSWCNTSFSWPLMKHHLLKYRSETVIHNHVQHSLTQAQVWNSHIQRAGPTLSHHSTGLKQSHTHNRSNTISPHCRSETVTHTQPVQHYLTKYRSETVTYTQPVHHYLTTEQVWNSHTHTHTAGPTLSHYNTGLKQSHIHSRSNTISLQYRSETVTHTQPVQHYLTTVQVWNSYTYTAGPALSHHSTGLKQSYTESQSNPVSPKYRSETVTHTHSQSNTISPQYRSETVTHKQQVQHYLTTIQVWNSHTYTAGPTLSHHNTGLKQSHIHSRSNTISPQYRSETVTHTQPVQHYLTTIQVWNSHTYTAGPTLSHHSTGLKQSHYLTTVQVWNSHTYTAGPTLSPQYRSETVTHTQLVQHYLTTVQVWNSHTYTAGPALSHHSTGLKQSHPESRSNTISPQYRSDISPQYRSETVAYREPVQPCLTTVQVWNSHTYTQPVPNYLTTVQVQAKAYPLNTLQWNLHPGFTFWPHPTWVCMRVYLCVCSIIPAHADTGANVAPALTQQLTWTVHLYIISQTVPAHRSFSSLKQWETGIAWGLQAWRKRNVCCDKYVKTVNYQNTQRRQLL